MTEPPTRTYFSGRREWRLNGQLHRLDGPAIEYDDGHREWWVNGERHRTDGPAYERPDGRREWYIRGRSITHRVLRYIMQGMRDANALSAALIDIEREGGL